MSMPCDDTDYDDIPTINVRMHTDDNNNDDEDFGNLETIDVLSTLSDESSITSIETDDPKQYGNHRFVHTMRSMRRSADKERSGTSMKRRLFPRRQRNFQNISLRREDPMTNVEAEKEEWNQPASHTVDPTLQKTPTCPSNKSEMRRLGRHRLRPFGRTCNTKDTPLPPRPRRSRPNGSRRNNSLKH
jgi:hypothetical protein